MVTTQEYAIMSDNVYGEGHLAPPSGWKLVDLTKVSLTSSLSNNKNYCVNTKSGFQAAAYVNSEGKIVIAFAGTDPSSLTEFLKDLAGNDWNIVNQKIPEQFEDAKNFYNAICQAHTWDCQLYQWLVAPCMICTCLLGVKSWLHHDLRHC